MASYDDLVPTATSSNYDDLVPKEEPGWFEPGSRSEAAARGFANSASFGLGKWVNGIYEASAYPTQGSSFWDDVTKSVEEQKKANTAAMQAHPTAYIAGAAAPAVLGGVAGATKAVSLGALPTTLAGQTALGAGVGAATGATESTTGKQLVNNVGTGAVLGGGLSVLGGGAAKLVSSLGSKAASNLLDSTVNATRADDIPTSAAAFDKLRSIFETPSSGRMTTEQLRDAAERTSYAINNPKEVGSQLATSQTGDVVRGLAPSAGQIGGDIGNTAMQAVPGAVVGHFMGGGGIGPSALGGMATSVASGAVKKLTGDIGAFGAMKFAGSPTMQTAAKLSPLAFGSAAGSVGPNTGPYGLPGMLGSYIDSQWANR